MYEFIDVKLVTTAFGNLTYMCNHIMCTIMYNTLFKTIHELAISPTRLRKSTSEIHHWFGQYVICWNCWLCLCPHCVGALGVGYFSTSHFGLRSPCSDDIASMSDLMNHLPTQQSTIAYLALMAINNAFKHQNQKQHEFHRRESITSFFEDSLQPPTPGLIDFRIAKRPTRHEQNRPSTHTRIANAAESSWLVHSAFALQIPVHNKLFKLCENVCGDHV